MSKCTDRICILDCHIHAECATGGSFLQIKHFLVVAHVVHPMQLFKVLFDLVFDLFRFAEVV